LRVPPAVLSLCDASPEPTRTRARATRRPRCAAETGAGRTIGTRRRVSTLIDDPVKRAFESDRENAMVDRSRYDPDLANIIVKAMVGAALVRNE